MKALFSLLLVSAMLVTVSLSAHRGGEGGRERPMMRPPGERSQTPEEARLRDIPSPDVYEGGGGAYDPYFGGAGGGGEYNYRDNPMYEKDVLENVRSGEAEQIENVENMEQEPDIG